ncbi:unnamed protein product [Rangifer tarandus platyrhynchus]|uniref:Uncharacterized protein n=2 Tax=Rangifer tarandus platyrhynchus TaxID=3082113 RepID=A0ABN8YUB7_RANTA|nr:unnamed protein product [Rangifer tarandus platyrhynchus]CAI9702723.1 unnamed protein product [Rangifer tarandus platyrhynchus]
MVTMMKMQRIPSLAETTSKHPKVQVHLSPRFNGVDLRPQAKQCASTCSRLSRLPAPRSSRSSDTTPLFIHFSGPFRHLPRSGLCFRCKGHGQDGSARAGPSRVIKLSHCFAVCFSAGVAYRAKRYRYLKPQAEKEKSISS